MTRSSLHQLPRTRVIRRLRAMGFKVEVMPANADYDFRLDGQVRVSLRVGRLTSQWKRFRVRGRSYAYRYPFWYFNFHRHGHIRRYCDVFICLPLMEDERADLKRAYIIPWEARGGSTFSLPPSQYRGRYARYRGAWDRLRTDERTPQKQRVKCGSVVAPTNVPGAGRRGAAASATASFRS